MKKEAKGTAETVGRKVLNGFEEALSIAVGAGTGLVTTTICMAFAPQEAPRAAMMAFRAGTYGLAGVTGTVAKTLTKDEIEEAEFYAKRAAVGTRSFLNKHRKNRVEMEVVEE